MRVIFATDGSEAARWSQEMLLALPLPQPLTVTIFSMVEVPQPPFTSLAPMALRAYSEAVTAMRREANEGAREVLSAAREALEQHGATITTRV